MMVVSIIVFVQSFFRGDDPIWLKACQPWIENWNHLDFKAGQIMMWRDIPQQKGKLDIC